MINDIEFHFISKLNSDEVDRKILQELNPKGGRIKEQQKINRLNFLIKKRIFRF